MSTEPVEVIVELPHAFIACLLVVSFGENTSLDVVLATHAVVTVVVAVDDMPK